MTKYQTFAFILCLFILNYKPCCAQTQLDSCIVKLKSAEFGEVFQARNTLLLKFQGECIPRLISLLEDTNYVKLANTADLIYPGSKEFYGHGWIVNYDIDWICVRSAWALEEITYQDFGYLTRSGIDKKTLLELHQKDYENYTQKGYHEVN